VNEPPLSHCLQDLICLKLHLSLLLSDILHIQSISCTDLSSAITIVDISDLCRYLRILIVILSLIVKHMSDHILGAGGRLNSDHLLMDCLEDLSFKE
jgi:hypothetical protein